MLQHQTRLGLMYAAALVFASLGAVAIAFDEPLPGFHDKFGALPLSVLGGSLLVSAVLLLLPATRRWSALFLTCYWSLIAAINAAILVVSAEPALANWVPISEAMIFAFVAVSLTHYARRPLRLALGVGLLLFGAVHLSYPEAIASMIPTWIPMREFAPFATGFMNLGCGVLIVTGFHSRFAAALIGLVFLSWLPIVHAPRLIENLASAYEWSFALTALGLALAALVIATQDEPGVTPSDAMPRPEFTRS